MNRIETVMNRMISQGFRAGTPASELQVRSLERQSGPLPDDYRSFLLTFGGGEPESPQAWRGLWRIENVWSLNASYKLPRTFPGLLAIGNQAFMMYALDLNDPARAPLVSLGLSSSLWEDVIKEAESFAEWMDELVPK